MADKSTLTVYHNARCSKSRCALEALDAQKVSYEVIEYMKQPLTAEEIKALVGQLGIRAEELIRKGEQIYKEVYAGRKLTAAQWYKAMAKHPELIERPIVVRDGKAVIARPVERIEEVL